MKLISRQSTLKGTVSIPASKSHTIRAVTIASLAKGISHIRNPLISNDTLCAVQCYQDLGAEIDTSDPAVWSVTGHGSQVSSPKEMIDVGNSGTTLRVAMGSAALAPPQETTTFTGDQQIQSRPIGPLMEALGNLGAPCQSIYHNGKAPVMVQGGLTGGQTTLEAPTSQYLSSLLLCTPLAPENTELTVTLLNEPGYVHMTLDWLKKQDIVYKNEDLDQFWIQGGQRFQPFDLPLPADFSSATFFLCAAALRGQEVTLTGLDFSDSQPDKAVVEYLQAMGACFALGPDHITIKASPLKGIEIDMNETPDALPAMAVTATFAQGTTKLVNVPQARNKETDRIACMARELKKMGADIEELPDGLIIKQSPLKPAHLTGHHDHRIVMALSLTGLDLKKPCTIDTAEAMNVTFPTYVQLMQTLGANMQMINDEVKG